MFSSRYLVNSVVAFLLVWGTAFGSVLTQPDTRSLLLAGLVVVVTIAAAYLVVCRAEDLLFGQCRTVRGPTAEEQRLRGAFRRHSHPDAAGRPRPRAPGPVRGPCCLPFSERSPLPRLNHFSRGKTGVPLCPNPFCRSERRNAASVI